jgi:hypothetical protein
LVEQSDAHREIPERAVTLDQKIPPVQEIRVIPETMEEKYQREILEKVDFQDKHPVITFLQAMVGLGGTALFIWFVLKIKAVTS